MGDIDHIWQGTHHRTAEFFQLAHPFIITFPRNHQRQTMPAIGVDETGTIGIAYSVPDLSRELSNDGKYLRSIMVAFIEPGYVMGDATGDYSEIPGDCYYE